MNNDMFKKLPPFKWFVLENFPFIEEDFDAITNYQLLCKIVEYLNLTIGKTNELGTQVEALTNWFENLDVQDEIDNKLDEMAESGDLAQIVIDFLNLNALICYDTLTELKASDNIINNSFLRTYGRNTYNDGKGAFYKVRTLTNADVIDNDLLVALTNYPTLVAEKMVNNDIINLQNNKQNILDKLVVFGDSWSDSNVTDSIWSARVSNVLNLTLHNYAVNGAGFVHPSNNLINTQVTTFINDSTVDKTKVKYVVIMGGINDYRNGITNSDIVSVLNTIINTLKTAVPQAKILYVSNCQYPYTIAQSFYWVQLHNFLSTSQSIATLNLDGTLGYQLFNNNNYFHLTQSGQLVMAKNIVASLTGGEITYYRNQVAFNDSEIRLIYATQRVQDMIEISLEMHIKASITSKTISISSPSLSYSGIDIVGTVGRSFRNIVAQVNNSGLNISADSEMSEGQIYKITTLVPVTNYFA